MSWFEVLKKDSSSEMRLICCPYAGGSASAFYPWCRYIAKKVELIAIQWPGRERRFNEPLLYNMKDIVLGILSECDSILDKPYVLVGHSVGAITMFELTRKLLAFSLRPPSHLIVMGCRAPHLPMRRKPIYQLTDEEFVKEIMSFNATPHEIMANQEFLEVFLPIIRADFTISETYQFDKGPPLPIDITVLNGSEDPTVLDFEVKAWTLHTLNKFNQFTIPGDHFFIKSHLDEVCTVINQLL